VTGQGARLRPPGSFPQQGIQWAEHGAACAQEHVGVDLGRAHTPMAELFLHGADVHAKFRQMGGEGIPQGVAGGKFLDPGLAYRHPNGLLNAALAEVMPAFQVGARVDAAAAGGNGVLLRPRARRLGVLSLQGVGAVDRPEAIGEVLVMEQSDLLQLLPRWVDEPIPQGHHPIHRPLAVAQQDGPVVDIEVLYPQTHRLHQAQSRVVAQAGDEPMRAGKVPQHLVHLVHPRDHRQAPRLPRPHYARDLGERPLQDHLVEEHQRVERLVGRSRFAEKAAAAPTKLKCNLTPSPARGHFA